MSVHNVALEAGEFNGSVSGIADLEIVAFRKNGGPLSKQISLDPSGHVVSDGSACVMSDGAAVRVPISGPDALADLLRVMGSEYALALGRLRDGLPDKVNVTTKPQLAAMGEDAPPDLIARTASFIGFKSGAPGFALIDYDRKGMPADVQARAEGLGGVYAALEAVLPQLNDAASVGRRSTSSGICRLDTMTELPGSGGAHLYVLVQDAADIPRFLAALHKRCWLAGLGWYMVGAGGQLLERSIIDRSVGAPERLVFEGAPVVIPPLAQDQTKRRPVVNHGILLDTRAACPDLTPAEEARLAEIQAAARERLKPEADRQRARFIGARAERLVASGLSEIAARRVIEAQLGGILLPDVLLCFDDLGEVLVSEVLASPDQYVGATLADPVEGVSYGKCKSKVLRRSDGGLWIHSFAHGGAAYELKCDARAIKAAIEAAQPADAPEVLKRLLLLAEVGPEERQSLIEVTATVSGVGIRALKAGITQAENDRRKAQAKAHRQKQTIAAGKPVIQLTGGRLAELVDLTESIFVGTGWPIYQRGAMLVRPGVQEFDAAHGRKTLAPTLVRHNTSSLMYDMAKVVTWQTWNDKKEDWTDTDPPFDIAQTLLSLFGRWDFRRITGITATPTLRPDGSILDEPGWDEATGLYYLHDPNLHMPEIPEAPAREQAIDALRLLEGLLVEFPFVDDVSQAVALSGMLTPCARPAMGLVPLHGFSAHSPGTGKSYLTDVASVIATGRVCPVSAASSNPEEVEKHLAGLVLAGVQLFSLDNVSPGMPLSGDLLCQVTERRLVRVRPFGKLDLQDVELVATPYATGNNLTASGDMTRRMVRCEMDAGVERPELREFKGDPVRTVMEDRGRYVAACLTICRAYIAAGMPGLLPPVASYAEWSDIVRSALVWLGCADPAASMDAIREDDVKLSSDKTVFAAWQEFLGLDTEFTTREIVAKANEVMMTGKGLIDEPDPVANAPRKAFRDALLSVAADKGSLNPDRLGYWLRSIKGQLKDGLRIMNGGQKAGIRSWKLVNR